MKTKILFITIICALSFIATSTAQTYYYNQPDTFWVNRRSPVTVYQCDLQYSAIVTLYNKKNVSTYTEIKYKNGDTLTVDIHRKWANRQIKDFELTNYLYVSQTVKTTVRNAMTEAQRNYCGREMPLEVALTFDSTTGKLIEVHFSFDKTDPFATIPATVYYNIEKTLIANQNMYLVPTEFGKSLNYIKQFFSVRAKD